MDDLLILFQDYGPWVVLVLFVAYKSAPYIARALRESVRRRWELENGRRAIQQNDTAKIEKLYERLIEMQERTLETLQLQNGTLDGLTQRIERIEARLNKMKVDE